MPDRNIVIIGGGLAVLSAGSYALRNDYKTTIIEHNVALGGVCTAWERPPYVVSPDDLLGHVSKKLHGLEGLYMAGQWVEPGGGVPTVTMSGRQVVELICNDADEPLVAT